MFGKGESKMLCVINFGEFGTKPFPTRRFIRFVFLLLILPAAFIELNAAQNNVRFLWKQAEKASRNGDFTASENFCRQILEIDKSNETARLKLSYVLLKQRRLAEAYNEAQEVLKSNKNSSKAYALTGLTLLQAGNLRMAVNYFYSALQIDPDEAGAWAGLGMIDFYENRSQDGLIRLRKAVFLDSDEPDYVFNLAQIAARIESYKESAAAYQKFLRIAPATDTDRRDRIQGLINFLKYLGTQKSLYSISGKSTVLPIEIVNNRPLMRVKINGNKKELRFVLDTGSGISVMSDETARLLGIQSVARGGNARAIGGEGKFEIVYGFVDSMQLNDITISSIPIYIRKFYQSADAVDGYIGLSVISKFLTTVDYENQTFSLIKQNKGKKNSTLPLPNLAPETFSAPLRTTTSGFLSSEVYLDGINVPLNFIVDTGATISVVSESLVSFASLEKHLQTDKLRVFGAAGVTENVESVLLPKVSMGKHTRKNLSAVVLNLLPINETAGFEQAGILGGNFLTNFRLTFDFQNALVHFEPNSSLNQNKLIKESGKVIPQLQ
jgi:tetratricopeptide (TPR) repeat protein